MDFIINMQIGDWLDKYLWVNLAISSTSLDFIRVFYDLEDLLVNEGKHSIKEESEWLSEL